MLQKCLLPGMACWLLVTAATAGDHLSAQQPSSAAGTAADASHQQVITQYCLTCHNGRVRAGGLALDEVAITNVGVRADVWEKVLLKLRMGAMPPLGQPRPDRATVDGFIGWLEHELDAAAARDLNPGRTGSVHRLNRSEYQNAIRDLLGLDVPVDSLLPVDDADRNGFDNVATMLSVSPLMLDRYLAAGRRLSRLALGIPPVGPVTQTYQVPLLLDQDGAVSEELPFGSRGGYAVSHYFPVDGEYGIKIRLRRQLYDYVMGLGSPHQIEVRVDGERILSSTVGGEATGTPPPASFVGEIFGDPSWEKYALNADAGLQARFRARAGRRVVGVSFVSRHIALEDGFHPRNGERDEWMEGSPSVESVAIDGPYSVEGPGDTPSRRAILFCRPQTAAEEEPPASANASARSRRSSQEIQASEDGCATKILSTIARRAYRRPITSQELATLQRFFRDGRNGGTFETGLQFGLERVLADPNFFFRVERDPAGAAPGAAYRLSDLELASRLSFFLWSSIPDEELLDLAMRGRLGDPAVLDQQVRRMLAAPRARKALVDNFAGQWLQLRPLRGAAPSENDFPNFDENLREAFLQETNLFVDSTLREDRSVVDLLGANYTFLNERLARHYQIPDVHGTRFRRVTLAPDQQRGGLLGHGSILTVTSYPNRTSPVLRGKWLLENILGTPPPPPPPDVPPLPDRTSAGAVVSVRQRLEEHRKNPTCANCHAPMDPLGFALENFDAIGGWRTSGEGGSRVDATGTLPDGTAIDGIAGLRTLLLSRRERFVHAMTEKLLSYAVGRGLEHYDMPAVRKIVRESAQDQYRWSSLILGVARSAPFQMRRSRSDGGQPPL